MGFASRIKRLQNGTKRLLTVLSIIISLIIIISGTIVNKDGLIVFGFTSFFIFWIFVRVFLWIKDGYDKDK